MGAGAARKKSGRLTLEADGMWSFVGRKREVWWIWVALDAVTRQVVAMVAGDRSEYTARCLWEALPDGYASEALERVMNSSGTAGRPCGASAG